MTRRHRTLLRRPPPQDPVLESDPLWYKDAIVYEAHVRSFQDSDGDGVGDFRGLSSRLDYLQDLGVTAVWLLPFYPSPLRDDGYDIADYTDVHPSYGTLADFKDFLDQAHARGIRVITELVLNHTSDEHPWFQRARRAPPGSPARDFYVWSDDASRYGDARIIFKDFESSNWAWDPLAKQYYWHRFYSHQPDLNWENPEVRQAMLKVVDFWLDLGVDGLRLDAVPYLIEREGTNCENLAETHAVLKQLRAHVDGKYRDRMLLAEANQWPEDAVQYFGEGTGDECHSAFHFPIMPRLFMALRTGNRFPIVDILQQTPTPPESGQWMFFLRNHDELTLEMVTDEERDYMYRVFATDPRARINLGIRRRLAPLLDNDRRKIELMNALLFSLPGTPVLYYGDEIGQGDNIYLGDRNGVRTPMQWSSDRNAGFSRANPQRLFLPITTDPEYHYEAVNVELQQANPHSLLWWIMRLTALRRRYRAFGRGSLEILNPANRKVLAYLRRHQGEVILVVANLSRSAQYVELDLSPYRGWLPVELFGHTQFPAVADRPYVVTLSPYAFHWFRLDPAPPGLESAGAARPLPLLVLRRPEADLTSDQLRGALEDVLPDHLARRRWFRGKLRGLRSVEIADAIPIQADDGQPPALFTVLQADYDEGEPDTYLLPLSKVWGPRAEDVLRNLPGAAVAKLAVRGRDEQGVLQDSLADPAFRDALLQAFRAGTQWRGAEGTLAAVAAPGLADLWDGSPLPGAAMMREQSNTSLVYGERLILKLFRVMDEGVNPDLEIGRFLTEQTSYTNSPVVAGWLEYRVAGQPPRIAGILQAYVANEGDAWEDAVDHVDAFIDRVLARPPDEAPPDMPGHLLELARQAPPAAVEEAIGSYLETARIIGRRLGELHCALASRPDLPDFGPERFSRLSRRGVSQSMRNLSGQVLPALRERLADLSPESREVAAKVLGLHAAIQRRYDAVVQSQSNAMRIRVHGDFHLGQVLLTGRDAVIIDFEGEPARPLSERRLKRNPLRDVASMVRSFHYAAFTSLTAHLAEGTVARERLPQLSPWLDAWRRWTAAAFLRAYLEAAAPADLLPGNDEELNLLLEAFMLDKAVYEVGYEMNNRPDWVHIPLQGILDVLGDEP